MRTDIINEMKRVIHGGLGHNLTELGRGTSRKVYRINTDEFGDDYNGKVIKYAKDAVYRGNEAKAHGFSHGMKPSNQTKQKSDNLAIQS